MYTWIFQGNPKVFDVDKYLRENKVITWSVRQKQFVNDIKDGDKVFIWRSDGGVKNSGGIVALCEVIRKPYVDKEEKDIVDLKVLEYRLNADDGMLLRSYLKECPKTINLPILKMTQSTNYKLDSKEAETIFIYWNNPETLKSIAETPAAERYLGAFKDEAKQWFKNCSFIKDYYEFFNEFKKIENLKTMEWEDVQKIGSHINAFRMALARKRALGYPNAPIEKYRNSFVYLIHGNDPLELRIDKFLTSEEYSLFGFGNSALSEIIGNLFPDRFCYFNQRDRVALENILGIKPAYSRGDKFSDKFIKFHKALEDNEIVDKYLNIVGKQTELPIYYEIDQFFSFLYERYSKKDLVIDDEDDNSSTVPTEDKPENTYSPSQPVEGKIEEKQELVLAKYTIDHLLAEVFMTPEKAEEIIETLDYKKNIILQGPPGVGKTFVAKRLAFLHSGFKDDLRVAMVQFHQSYSYEDFIMGYKPSKEGNFVLKHGIFYDFCSKAMKDLDHNYYMIIDEINRGNLSKIFGELMMLIEADKRGKNYAVSLTYSEGDERFYIPENLYIIGTMNTADRSLALVDYALRRRFAFIDLEPAFETDSFKEFLISKGCSQGFIDKLIESMGEINKEIENDKINLGKGYRIGHSYFCPTADKVDDEEKWLNRVIKLEIEPLLKEYWFDEDDKVSDLIARLR